jgi:acetoin utilization deacetylase AcuC-like enzyme
MHPSAGPSAPLRYPRVALYVHHPASHLHETGPHPENAGRLVAIEAALEEREWMGLERIEAPAATREALERVHDPAHIDAMEEFASAGGGMIDHDTVASAHSYEAALRSAGGATMAAERLLAGDARSAFCGLRPPGHHAERDRAMGFCLFNNVAVAAAHAIAECGAERVLVLDWDVHHGNGTEAIFADSDEVLYVSIHQSPLYPGTGDAGFTGVGGGEGYTVNLPVPPGSGPDDFLALVQHVVAPVAREFRPGLLAISAGYDAHRADPLASCLLDEDAYADMSASMRDLGAELEAPVLVCLEGGYDPPALARSVIATIAALDSERAARQVDVGTAAAHRDRVARAWPSLGP